MREGAERVPVDGGEHSSHGPRALFNTCGGFSSAVGCLGCLDCFVGYYPGRVLPPSVACSQGLSFELQVGAATT